MKLKGESTVDKSNLPFFIGNIAEMFVQAAAQYKNKTAVVYNKNSEICKSTYEKLLHDVQCVSSYLLSKGFQNAYVVLDGKLTYTWIVAFLSIISISSTVVCPTPELLKSGRLDNILKSKKVVLIYEKEQNCIKSIKSLSIESILKCINNGESKQIKSKDISHNLNYKPALVLFTSGTSGKSKAVCFTHNNISSDIMACQFMLKRNSEDRLLSFLPVYHAFEITVGILTPLYVGATICLSNGNGYMLQDMRSFSPTIMPVVPAIAQSLKKRIEFEMKNNKDPRNVIGDSLNTIVNGGASLDVSVQSFFNNIGVKCLTGYGITECSPVVSCSDVKTPAGSVGKPSPFCSIKIEKDEIMVSGPIVAEKDFYGFNGEMKMDNVWFKTGDLGRLDVDGNLFVLGRIDEMLVLQNGEIVAPALIERILLDIENVDDVMCYIDKSVFNSEGIIAVVFSKIRFSGDHNLKWKETEKNIKSCILPYNIRIAKVLPYDKPLPRTHLGKLQRNKIKKEMEMSMICKTAKKS